MGILRNLKEAGRTRRELDAALSQLSRLQGRLQELEAGRGQIEGILQSMQEGVLVVSPQENLLLVNEAALRIFGIGREGIPGRPFTQALRYPDLQELVRKVLKTGQPESREMISYAPSERHLQVHATTCPYSSAGSCAVLVVHDITDLKRLEQVRRDFVANVSHELKTPLTAIRGAAETLLEGALKDPDRGRPFVESIAEEAARLTHLVEDLLTLAQVESRETMLNKERIRIGPFLEEQVERQRVLAKAHQVDLKLKPAPADLFLPADRNHLAQAVGNLVENAIKYNRPGGSVAIRFSVEGRDGRIEVADTGIGIPAEDLPRVFERFYRVDKARSRETGGTGLGLSIVKHVAETHGGSVQVDSRPGQGSRFTLSLPL